VQSRVKKGGLKKEVKLVLFLRNESLFWCVTNVLIMLDVVAWLRGTPIPTKMKRETCMKLEGGVFRMR
jgi:hypothetical protein